jgi:hypothetical protein
MNINTLKQVALTYARAAGASVVALYMAGVTDPADLWTALVAALAPVLLRAVNPNDKSFGVLPTASAVEVALKNIKAGQIKKKVATKKSVKK